MVVMGIDPGSHRVGYAFLEKPPGSRSQLPKILISGTIDVPAKTPTPANLLHIHNSIIDLIELYKPDRACVEDLFFMKNKKTAQQVYEARGVILYCLGRANLSIYHLTVSQIKKGISSSGTADKKAIRRSIQMIFGIKPKGHDDSWDAIACAFVGFSL